MLLEVAAKEAADDQDEDEDDEEDEEEEEEEDEEEEDAEAQHWGSSSFGIKLCFGVVGPIVRDCPVIEAQAWRFVLHTLRASGEFKEQSPVQGGGGMCKSGRLVRSTHQSPKSRFRGSSCIFSTRGSENNIFQGVT